MDINKPVIVTALFDIGRDKWDCFDQSYGGYIDWMERLLSFDCNMVIYTDANLCDSIIARRIKYDTDLTKTIVIVKPLEEHKAYQLFYDNLNTLMQSEAFKKKIAFNVPEMTKPLYNIIMFNKAYFLQDCAKENYFDADLLIWMDAACYREEIRDYNRPWPNLDKINQLANKITFFSHHLEFSIFNRQDHLLSQMRIIQGGCFFVPKHLIDRLSNAVTYHVMDSINRGYIGSDEKIFDLCYLDNKEICQLIQCNWREYYNLFK